MARRVYAIKVIKTGDVVYVRALGRNDRGQTSLIAHASGIAEGKGKITATKLTEELLAFVKEA